MKAHTSEFKEQIKTLGRELDSIVSFNGTELSVEQLNSVTPHYEGGLLKSVMKQLDIDSNIEIPVGTIVNYKLGVKVNDEYEYLNFGNYVVNKIEKQEDFNSYMITCYDKMLYSMKDYEKLNISYPISIRDYITAICEHLGIAFKNKNEEFANYDKMIQNELYLDENNKSLGYTFRDVLDELAQVTASTICVNDNDELEIRYINDTQDIIDEEFFKDINVNFGEKYGPINSIVLSRSAGSDNVYLRDETSVSENGLTELKISDNQIMNWNDRSDYLEDILNKLNGLEYYLNDFLSTGICYYELCDKYNVQIGNNIYSCIMLNDDINVTQGLVEEIFTEKLEVSETDYTKSDKTDIKMNKTNLIVDKQNGIIQGIVERQEQIEINTEINKQISGSSIKIEDAGAYLLNNIEIEGKSVQDGTPTPNAPVEIESVEGITNLFDKDNAENGIAHNFGVIGDIPGRMVNVTRCALSPTNAIKVKPNTTYILKNKNGWNFTIGELASNKTLIQETGWKSNLIYTITTSSTTEYICFNFALTSNATITDELFDEYINVIQFEKGSIAHSYVPYGRWLEQKTIGKNKFNPNERKDNVVPSSSSGQDVSVNPSFSSNYIKVNNVAYFKWKAGVFGYLFCYDENYNHLGNKGNTSGKISSTETASNVKYVRIRFDEAYKEELEIIVSNEDTPYEPYKENTALIDLNIYDEEGNITDYYRLASIGDTKDTFKDGVLTQRIGKVVLDNAGNWYVNGNHYQLTFYTNLDVLKGKIPMSNYFKGVLYSSNELGISLTQSDNISYLRINNASSVFSSLSEFKTWLGENLVEVYYELATPIEHTLDYEPLQLFKGYNNISVDEDITPNMNIIYLTDSNLNAQYTTKTEFQLENKRIKQSVSAEINELGEKTEASLELKIDKNDNDEIVSMINASAKEINLKSNRLTVESDNFNLTADGEISSKNATLENVKIDGGIINLTSSDEMDFTKQTGIQIDGYNGLAKRLIRSNVDNITIISPNSSEDPLNITNAYSPTASLEEVRLSDNNNANFTKRYYSNDGTKSINFYISNNEVYIYLMNNLITTYIGTDDIKIDGESVLRKSSITTQDFTSDSITLNSSATQTITFDVTKTGYTAIGIVQVDSSNNNVSIQKFSVYGKNAYLTIKNTSSSSVTLTTTIKILYIKE